MSKVIRQGIWTSIISYAGVVLGYLNLIVLYPKFLNLEQIGLLRTIQDAALLFAPFAQLGLGPAIIRFYPHVAENRDQAHGFVTSVLLLSLVGFGIFVLLFVGFEQPITGFFSENAGAILDYTHLILWLTFLLLVITVLEFYGRSLLKVSFPNFLREVGIRFLQAALVFLYFMKWITFHQFLVLSVVIYLVSLCGLAVYLFVLGRLNFNLDFSFFRGPRIREFFSFSLLTFIGNSAVILIAKVDSLMVSGMLGLAFNAVYTTAFYMATLIEIPKRTLVQLALPLLSEAFQRNDMKEVARIYQKTSINQTIAGLLLLIGIWVNLDNIFALMPKGEFYHAGAYVVLLIGLSKWIDMAFGPNGEIILLSRHYWVNIILISFLAALVIAANYLLIPIYGMNGAAFGSALAVVVFNLAKYFIILIAYKVQPFNMKTVQVLVIGGLAIGLNQLLPAIHAPLLDALYRSALITLLFGSLVIGLRVSDEALRIVNGALGFVGIRKRF